MKKVMLFFIISIIIIVSACTCSTCGKQSELIEIPEKVKKGSEEYIISKTGKEFFEKNIFPDLINTKMVSDYYEMHYVLSMMDHDFVNEPIIFFVDSLGKVNEKYEIKGIPNCIENEQDCEFNITKEMAVEIAEQNNLVKGIRDWDLSFRWHGKLKKYIWHIISTTKEIGNIGSEMYKAEGEEIILNPNDGEILSRSEWKIN